MIEILSMSPGLLLQDVGRNGWRRFGVPSGGAMDQRSMALATACERFVTSSFFMALRK